MDFLKYASIIAVIIFAFPPAAGYGLASEYLDNKTLMLSPGQTKEYKIELQNNDMQELRFEFIVESSIAKIKNKKDYYIVGNQNKIEQIILEIEMPVSTKPGEKYSIKYSTVPITEGTSSVNLNLKLSNEIFAVASGEVVQEKKPFNPMMPTLFIIALTVFTTVIIFRKNKLIAQRVFRR